MKDQSTVDNSDTFLRLGWVSNMNLVFAIHSKFFFKKKFNIGTGLQLKCFPGTVRKADQPELILSPVN